LALRRFTRLRSSCLLVNRRRPRRGGRLVPLAGRPFSPLPSNGLARFASGENGVYNEIYAGRHLKCAFILTANAQVASRILDQRMQ
jgi:hypothetical protein